MLYDPRRRTASGERQVSKWLQGVTAGVGSPIKSIQSGKINLAGATSATATISAVVVANTMLFFNGKYAGGGLGSNTVACVDADITLTNTTTVTASRHTSTTGVYNVEFVAIEFNSGILNQAIQFGTVSIPSGASGTATITSVVTAKAFVVYLGETGADNTNNYNYLNGPTVVELTNSTTVTAFVAGAGQSGALTVRFCVVEFL